MMPYNVYAVDNSLVQEPFDFDVSTMSLEGIPAYSSSKPFNYLGAKYLPVTFKDTKGVLNKKKGNTALFKGVVPPLGNQLPLCFTRKIKVCAN